MRYDVFDKNGKYQGTIAEAANMGMGGCAAVASVIAIPLVVILVALIIWPVYFVITSYQALTFPLEWVWKCFTSAMISTFISGVVPCVSLVVFLIKVFLLTRKTDSVVGSAIILTLFELWLFTLFTCFFVDGQWSEEFLRFLQSRDIDHNQLYYAQSILGFWIGLLYVICNTVASFAVARKKWNNSRENNQTEIQENVTQKTVTSRNPFDRDVY